MNNQHYNFIQDVTNQEIIDFLDSRNNTLSSHITEIKRDDKRIIVTVQRAPKTCFDCVFSSFSCRLAGLSYSKQWNKFMINKYAGTLKQEQYITGLKKHIISKNYDSQGFILR